MNDFEKNRPITVGIDGSRTASNAALWAVREARLRNSTAILVHAVTPLAHPESVFGAPDVDGDYARNALEAAFDAVTRMEPGVRVEIALAQDGSVATMLGESTTSSLVVLGSGSDSLLTGLVLGSTMYSVVESAACPVAVVREFDPERRGPVVVGVGKAGRYVSDRVEAEAYRAASNRGAKLVRLQATSTVGSLVHAAGRARRGHVDDDSRPSSAESYPDVLTTDLDLHGGAGQELVARSHDAQLLVLGHQRGRPLGTTLIRVLREADCPVLVVPYPRLR